MPAHPPEDLVSPILVRPVREQFEHDRVIRLLQARHRRRYDVGINPGAETNVAVGSGTPAIHPDLLLSSPERGHRPQVVIEVETAESINHLEAMAQWARLARLRPPFHLYVPAGSVDVARRLCTDHLIAVAEIWTYHTVGDQVRFTMVFRAPVEKRAGARLAGGRSRAAGRTAAARARGKTTPRKSTKRPAAARSSRAQKRK